MVGCWVGVYQTVGNSRFIWHNMGEWRGRRIHMWAWGPYWTGLTPCHGDNRGKTRRGHPYCSKRPGIWSNPQHIYFIIGAGPEVRCCIGGILHPSIPALQDMPHWRRKARSKSIQQFSRPGGDGGRPLVKPPWSLPSATTCRCVIFTSWSPRGHP